MAILNVCQSSYIPYNMSMFYTLLHAVLHLLMLKLYLTGIIFINTVRLLGDGLDEDEVESS